MATYSRELWDRVDELRGEMTVKELAAKSGINERTLESTKSLGTLPKVQMLYPLARTLGTTMEYLYAGIEESEYSDNPVFRKISSSQLLFDITSHLANATPEEVEMVRRMLEIPKSVYEIKPMENSVHEKK